MCDKTDSKKRSYGTGCYKRDYVSSRRCCCHGRAADGCAAGLVYSCDCRSNAGCPGRSDCGGSRYDGDACPGPCQCAEEEIWNSNAPPKPNCRWLSDFAELRRQWSYHSRRQMCKCRSCNRSCRTVAPCRSCPPPTSPCSGAISAASDCQRCCCRLAGGASTSEMAPADKPASPNRPLKREAGGGGCPPPSCDRPSTRCNSPNVDCSSTASSSCCPSQCSRYSTPSSSECRQPCVSPLRSILKKRDRGNMGHCLCQPMPRDCNCPPPVQVDARATRECTCECPSSPECACPPGERRFPKTTVKCPNARSCCPFPRQSPRCWCARCQPCSTSSCESCTSAKCRAPVQPRIPCRPCSPCPSCSPCRPPCKKLTACSRPSSSCRTGPM